MDRKFAVALGAALLLVAGVVVVQQRGSSHGGARAEAGDPSRGSVGGAGAGGGKSERPGRSAGDRIDAVRVLRSVLGKNPSSFSFAEIEELVKRVSDEDLMHLRELALPATPDSRAGWVRCAIFAGLARRDPEAAFEFLAKDAAMREMDFWGIRQAWFSTFRGWSGVDAAAAVAQLSEYIGPRNQTGQVTRPVRGLSAESYDMLVRRDDIWKRQAFMEVFAQFARSDPEAAWEAVPELDMAGLRESALEGIFRGLEGSPALPEILERWESDNALVMMKQIQEVSGVVDDGLRIADPFERSDRQSISIQAALSLAASDAAQADRWLSGSGLSPEPSATHGNRQRLFYHELAHRDPDRLITMIGEGSERSTLLLHTLVAAYPERAAEFFELLPSPDFHTGALLTAINGASRLDLEDLFPAPGRSNGLPEYVSRYEALQEAIDSAGLEPAQEEDLRRALREEFEGVVPGPGDESPSDTP